MSIFRTAIITIVVLTLGVVGYYGYSIYHFAQDSEEDSLFAQFSAQENSSGDTDQPKKDEYVPPKWEGKDRVNILLMGGDSRGLAKNEVPRTDTMMIVSIDPVTKKAHLLSLLRDTYVRIPGHGSERINSAIVLGGPKLAMQTVSDLTGLNIQYYVYTDFQGFVHLIDEIGGITYEVEKNMRYTSKADGPEYDIDLKKGLQHMDGHKALQYMRFRHDAMSDYARTERQRNFMKAVAQKLQSTTSIIRLPRILAAVDPYIESNLSVAEMLKLGSLAFEAKANEVAGLQLPPSSLLREETVRGASVLTVDDDKLRKYIADAFEQAAADHTADNTPDEPKDAAASKSGTRGES